MHSIFFLHVHQCGHKRESKRESQTVIFGAAFFVDNFGILHAHQDSILFWHVHKYFFFCPRMYTNILFLFCMYASAQLYDNAQRSGYTQDFHSHIHFFFAFTLLACTLVRTCTTKPNAAYTHKISIRARLILQNESYSYTTLFAKEPNSNNILCAKQACLNMILSAKELYSYMFTWCSPQKSPHCPQASKYLPQKSPVHTKKSPIHIKKSSIYIRKIPYTCKRAQIHTKEPYTHTQEAYIHKKEPTHMKKAFIHNKGPCIHKKAYMHKTSLFYQPTSLFYQPKRAGTPVWKRVLSCLKEGARGCTRSALFLQEWSQKSFTKSMSKLLETNALALWVPVSLSKEPCIVWKETCIVSKEPCIVSKEPCIVSKEPCIVSTEPRIVSTEPCILRPNIEKLYSDWPENVDFHNFGQCFFLNTFEIRQIFPNFFWDRKKENKVYI